MLSKLTSKSINVLVMLVQFHFMVSLLESELSLPGSNESSITASNLSFLRNNPRFTIYSASLVS